MASAVFLPPAGGVLVASPSAQVRDRVLQKLVQRQGPVHIASGGAEALAMLESGHWQMLFLDRQLPDLDAEELAISIGQSHPGIQVVLLDSLNDESAKSPSLHSPLPWVRNPGDAASVSSKAAWVNPGNNFEPLPGMIGDTEPMRQAYRMVRLVARRNTTVLITGPTGTGKELVARALHQLSGRAGNCFSVLNCAAIPEALVESELFGYARGAFTGAMQTYSGRILAAQSGTLFLDEIGELPLSAQSKVLRFLEQKEIQRLGSAETTRVDVRVVAATNRNLAGAVEKGEFREDLFYRLCAFPVELVALAERAADIPRLAAHFLSRLAEKNQGLRLDAAAQQMLEAHSWPGNVRELQQVLERAVILAQDASVISPEHLIFNFGGKSLLIRKAS
jgi:DNA-binding NtrC family response regulator